MDFNYTRTITTTALSMSLCILLAGCENADAVSEHTQDASFITIPVEAEIISRGTITSTYSTTAILEA
ncbi:efflux RND transporter periplasmic adaptor subunit, partial [Alteromonas sp. 14N.309.X.WAT.G.H12]